MPALAIDILNRLVAHPKLAQTLQLQQIQRLLEFTRRIWPEIVGQTGVVPVVLPPQVVAFLSPVLRLPHDIIALSWLAFSDIAAAFQQDPIEPSLDDEFRLHANDHQIDCHTRYYPNYFVQQASNPAAMREYYNSAVPQFIHVTESSFVERQLCEYFEMQMAVTHSSAEGIAHVYNLALGLSSIPNASRLMHQLDGELVLDAFFHNAVLRDKAAQHQVLSVTHHGDQRRRLDAALQERNTRMMGTGQEFWAHACNRCMKLYQGEDGNWYQITAGVHDGVTVRHLACSVHNCTEPLPSQKARFCSTHAHLKDVCYIRDCNSLTQPGFRTCTLESHRAHELGTIERHAAMFQLHNRLQKSGIPHVPKAGSSSASTTKSTVPSPAVAEKSSASASSMVKGKNSRSWTHNEQLFVRCCGVIISRVTFFGSEGVSGVAAFLKATFPPAYPGAIPSYIFYDNNCTFKKFLLSSGDHYFDNVGLPVDVWHFKCKHTERDVFCQFHCNPARFQELIGEDGNWIFNSSAAEQSNAWFGKFQSVVQEMNVLRCLKKL
ncbi:hypothetical protein MVEN_00325900 [Mycena venus]|uniref:CxC6 like cysteine cluster associated with KDZ domain-containing protein n=1 Tax=Mycena venus TaxID=2733690 RepID=A0A8H7D6Y8_9AGAR|nr:hypothetical protein MVEN_00325900 [Mycena venus]